MIRRSRQFAPVLLLGLSGCSSWVLHSAGSVGDQDRLILLDALAVMLTIAVPTILATLAFAVWYREGNARARYRPDFTFSGRLELLVWSIPTLVILFLGGIIWVGSHALDPAQPLPGTPLEIEAVAMDWKWLFLYPQQGVASINQLTVPAGRPLHFRVTSASVFNSFFVPQLGSQIYAMPGMAANLNLIADHPGHFHGLSAQFSGDGFSKMGFDLHAVPQAAFDRWAAQAKQSGAALDSAAYRGLLKQSQAVAPQTFRTTMPGLFDAVVAQGQPRGQGFAQQMPDRDVHPTGGH